MSIAFCSYYIIFILHYLYCISFKNFYISINLLSFASFKSKQSSQLLKNEFTIQEEKPLVDQKNHEGTSYK